VVEEKTTFEAPAEGPQVEATSQVESPLQEQHRCLRLHCRDLSLLVVARCGPRGITNLENGDCTSCTCYTVRTTGRYHCLTRLAINLRPVQFGFHQLLYLGKAAHVHVMPYQLRLVDGLPLFICSDAPGVAEFQDLKTLFFCQVVALIPRREQAVP
jgi:hypothetical protein